MHTNQSIEMAIGKEAQKPQQFNEYNVKNSMLLLTKNGGIHDTLEHTQRVPSQKNQSQGFHFWVYPPNWATRRGKCAGLKARSGLQETWTPRL